MAARSPASHRAARVVPAERGDGEIAAMRPEVEARGRAAFADIEEIHRVEIAKPRPVDFQSDLGQRAHMQAVERGLRFGGQLRREAKVALFQDADRHGHDRRLGPERAPRRLDRHACAIPTDMRRRRFETDRHVRAEPDDERAVARGHHVVVPGPKLVVILDRDALRLLAERHAGDARRRVGDRLRRARTASAKDLSPAPEGVR